jgi:SAM-dependent methyltransferase
LFFGKGDYLGVDLLDGPGVDCVVDLTSEFAAVDEELEGERFGTIICLSVLEHCAQPFRMAENLTRLLKPGGKICISAPFAWKFHGYPSDYWRFTHEGIKVLFPKIEFDAGDCCSSTSYPGEFQPIDEDLGKRSLNGKTHRGTGHLWRGFTASTLKLFAKLAPLGWITRYRYLLAPTNVFMIGQYVEAKPFRDQAPENSGSLPHRSSRRDREPAAQDSVITSGGK